MFTHSHLSYTLHRLAGSSLTRESVFCIRLDSGGVKFSMDIVLGVVRVRRFCGSVSKVNGNLFTYITTHTHTQTLCVCFLCIWSANPMIYLVCVIPVQGCARGFSPLL